MERLMENMMFDTGDYRTEMAARQLSRTIEFASLRCLSPTEIMNKISGLDGVDDQSDHVTRLLELKLNRSEFRLLERVMTTLAQRAGEASSPLKNRIDRVLLRLVRALPSDAACRFVEPYVDHRLKTMRGRACSALRNKQISESIVEKLVEVFRKAGDQEALELIARNPERVPKVGGEFLLTNLKERYWRARVLEALLMHDRPTALALAGRFPFEFTHAVGRTQDRTLLEPVRGLFEANSKDIEFLSIYAYALGKLSAKGDLESLKKYLAPTNLGASRRPTGSEIFAPFSAF
jgi:hypothetical protein